ncbi:hypothetical protein Tco_0546187 [Tanacetum coccineum]
MGKISNYQIIRADGSSKRYSTFIQMLRSFDMEDLETLWKLVKAKHGYTRPEEGYERVLWGDLKTMFENHVEVLVWEESIRKTKGYGVDVDSAFPRYWIRRIQGIGYGVSKVLDMAYWGFLE